MKVTKRPAIPISGNTVSIDSLGLGEAFTMFDSDQTFGIITDGAPSSPGLVCWCDPMLGQRREATGGTPVVPRPGAEIVIN